MLPLSTLLATIDVADRRYWLGHCEGFHVRSGGRRLGVVESVRYGSDPSLPHTIHVSAGIMHIREIAVPCADVERIDPPGRTIWVRTNPPVRTRRRRRVAAWLHRAGARPRAVSRATPRGAQ
jgi:hypothetical protein